MNTQSEVPTLQAFVDGELNAEETQEINMRMRTDPKFAQEVHDFQILYELAKQRWRRELHPVPAWQIFVRRYGVAAAAAVAVALAAVLWLNLPGPEPKNDIAPVAERPGAPGNLEKPAPPDTLVQPPTVTEKPTGARPPAQPGRKPDPGKSLPEIVDTSTGGVDSSLLAALPDTSQRYPDLLDQPEFLAMAYKNGDKLPSTGNAFTDQLLRYYEAGKFDSVLLLTTGIENTGNYNLDLYIRALSLLQTREIANAVELLEKLSDPENGFNERMQAQWNLLIAYCMDHQQYREKLCERWQLMKPKNFYKTESLEYPLRIRTVQAKLKAAGIDCIDTK